ncbi:MAG: lytic transglycosylase domain-containing protein [Rhizomicrobium sp.]
MSNVKLLRSSAGAMAGTLFAAVAALFPSTISNADHRAFAPNILAPLERPLPAAAVVPPAITPRPKPSVYAQEQRMGASRRMKRWDPFVTAAARRFAVPKAWLYAVMQLESGGYTMLSDTQPIVSGAGAMGLMQLMPQTYAQMRRQLGLGSDPFDPHDNIFAAAAYLHWLKGRYGYPAMFAAYNDGPGNLEARMRDAGLLPQETQNYLIRINAKLSPGTPLDKRFTAMVAPPRAPNPVKFTDANGAPEWIDINAAPSVSVRAARPGEFASGIRSVVTVGRAKHGVWEAVAMAQYRITSHGGTLESGSL